MSFPANGGESMRILTVAAHPDDETLGAGGTMARFAARGDEVWVCILTDGVTSRHGHIELQKECAVRATNVLGVSKVVFCDLPDQRIDALPLIDVITPIEKCIGELQPDVVFTHFKEDANQDHRTVFAATLVAARPVEECSVRRLLCYEVASSTEWAAPFSGSVFAPNVFVDITSSLSTKLEAMRAYEDTFSNEMRPYPHPRSYEAIEAYAKRYGAASGLASAEPFMLVRDVFPEGVDDDQLLRA
jgi:LmbE family N-acetylglucosaminyl deacetylase